MPVLPMFPLGSVLLPHMPLRLQVFEPRYLTMVAEMLQRESTELGVVLIERGQEVGGGEQRFGYGTVAEITALGSAEGLVGLVAVGTRRFRVDRWLDDDPFPRAEVTDLPELAWDDGQQALRDRAEQVVRRGLALASEFADDVWPATVELSEDPMVSTWQLAGIAPLSAMDQLRLLRADSVPALLTAVIEETEAAAAGLSAPWPADDGG